VKPPEKGENAMMGLKMLGYIATQSQACPDNTGN
jgi:hypothetical protein